MPWRFPTRVFLTIWEVFPATNSALVTTSYVVRHRSVASVSYEMVQFRFATCNDFEAYSAAMDLSFFPGDGQTLITLPGSLTLGLA
jgi:hypothetical protein